jgi:hypothetical protein
MVPCLFEDSSLPLSSHNKVQKKDPARLLSRLRSAFKVFYASSSFLPLLATKSHPPLCVLFQREDVEHQPFPDLQRDCVPVFASTFAVKVENMWIQRHQVPMAPAFAVTEYKAQGSTYRYAMLDLSRKDNARGEDAVHARHCSVYVQLSRLRRMESVWLLEPIKLSDLCHKVHRELVAEDKRLERLAAATLQSETEALAADVGRDGVGPPV